MRMLVVATVAVCAALAGRSAVVAQTATPQGGAPAAQTQGEETPAQRDARMAWWRQAKFGMFIHWGVYAVPAGTYDGERISGIGEWIMLRGRIPVARYKEYARQFNPVKYDPESWAQLAADAGMKYLVITSKHHDGFALFDSSVTDWDIAGATPYGKDLLEPLAAAARKRGLKFGLYYSQSQDWTHPGGAKADMREGTGWDDAHLGSYDKYLAEIALPQTREILTRYQPDVLWWDTPVWMTHERAKPLAALLALRPGIITNNRLGGDFRGDTETPEQFIPATGFKDRDWETCMTLNDTWGFKSYDTNWKSTETIVRNLVDIVSKGGNYLLNVGPTAEGEIPRESIERLRAVGAWMKVHGSAIYGVTASPCRAPAWGRVARKGDRLYLYVFDWPADGRLTVPVQAQATEGRVLGGAGAVHLESTEEGLTVTVTGPAPNPICSVVEIDAVGPVVGLVQRATQQADGTLTLAAEMATVLGATLELESIEGRQNLGYWTRQEEAAEWPCRIVRGGDFEVLAEVAGPDPSQIVLQVGDAELSARVEATGGHRTFRTVSLGRIAAPAGDVTVTLRPGRQGWRPVNVRQVILRRAE
ncbi:MAG TPA: alpha-L-fucosidase [Lacipirellulaceae bacterium]|nr:alpha-L-fucosidase [Lacipirellulaceae bacterium]